MTDSTVRIRHYPDGLRGIVPVGAPAALDAAPGPDTLVLEVIGGYLIWNVLAGQRLPAALIDDVDAAQEWVWAIYGLPVAAALDSGDREAEAPAAPALPALAVSARRLAYAHWASRWWPASTLDGIATLDPALLDRDIALLTEECESLVDGADVLAPPAPAVIETSLRASDYALAAGDGARPAGALVLARGTGGWDWRACPPGLVDASESAVSWQLVRDAGATAVAISVAAHPDLPAAVPAHLRPWARIDTGHSELDTELRAADDTWIGESVLPAPASTVRIAIHVPGFGPDTGPRSTSAPADAALRQLVRDFASTRLREAAAPTVGHTDLFAPLLAEIAAAAADSDF
ncbi:hypothetical protein [Nocardia aurantiaca]|uniref:Uncharacterized protein n=1 Tax=Nocardia aurantiaca TaxID=2675850 RepID=A0A6I3KRC8_9NOCA|nr:hypothetical protein [Nocardia aurantiaca]MTE12462.1 hypothetical protein [Nocardia aurantiaca]